MKDDRENKVFYLSTCDTCKRIMREVEADHHFVLQDIKEKVISADELDYAASIEGSYEALFNKRARKYRSLGLNAQDLTEKDWRKLILDEYTFLKRPLFFYNGTVYSGNSKKTVERLKDALNKKN